MDSKENIEELTNKWLHKIGAAHLTYEDLGEYKPGQLLFATEHIDCIFDWDIWQHLQNCMKMELSYDLAISVDGLLWENEIETIELTSVEASYNGTPEERRLKQRLQKEQDRIDECSNNFAMSLL